MSTENNESPTALTASAGGVVAAPAFPDPPQQQQQQQQQQPSLYARKLLQKLSSLQPPASSESREAIASWIVFNRKKCDGVGEGMLAYIAGCDGDGGGGGGAASSSSSSSSARLVLLLRILHAVLVSDVADDDKWAKSSPLRARLGEVVVGPLLRALARSSAGLDDDGGAGGRAAIRDKVRSAMEEWRDHDAFGGPTVWEDYSRGWTGALREADAAAAASAATTSAGEADWGNVGVESTTDADAIVEHDASTTTSTDGDDAARETSKYAGRRAPDIAEASGPNDATESVDIVDEKRDERGESDEVVDATSSSSSFGEEIGNDKAVPAATRDGVAGVDVEIDFEVSLHSIFVLFLFFFAWKNYIDEFPFRLFRARSNAFTKKGVEAANVEPAQFLEACKVIASIQITRDLGSDVAMNLSSALSSIPLEVEKACNVILTQQQNGRDETTPITDLVSVENLSNLPDEVLDLDIKYARQSLQTYREAIRQQRMARLQCLHLLLQSRCSFGSVEAAHAFCGGNVGYVSMNAVLERLKKRKEILVDAMALEGLDVEEDEEEKKLEKEEEELKPLSWFPNVHGKVAEEEPAEKRIKFS